MGDLSDCTVMVVDDTEANIDILVEALADFYEIVVATDGQTALESIDEQIPDLILLDIMMPGIDGYEVLKRVKSNKKTRHVPIIFVTALGDQTDETKGLELGAVDYITKPFSPPIVLARVKNHLELKRAREELEKQNEVLLENARLREDVDRITRHDLKSPLNSVIAFPELIRSYDNLNDDQDELLEVIEEGGYQMLEMINRSLDLYKM